MLSPLGSGAPAAWTSPCASTRTEPPKRGEQHRRAAQAVDGLPHVRRVRLQGLTHDPVEHRALRGRDGAGRDEPLGQALRLVGEPRGGRAQSRRRAGEPSCTAKIPTEVPVHHGSAWDAAAAERPEYCAIAPARSMRSLVAQVPGAAALGLRSPSMWPGGQKRRPRRKLTDDPLSDDARGVAMLEATRGNAARVAPALETAARNRGKPDPTGHQTRV